MSWPDGLYFNTQKLWLESYPQLVSLIYKITKKNLTRQFFSILLEISGNYAFYLYK